MYLALYLVPGPELLQYPATSTTRHYLVLPGTVPIDTHTTWQRRYSRHAGVCIELHIVGVAGFCFCHLMPITTFGTGHRILLLSNPYTSITLKLVKVHLHIRGATIPSRAIHVAATSVRRSDWWCKVLPAQEGGGKADDGIVRTRKGMEVGIQYCWRSCSHCLCSTAVVPKWHLATASALQHSGVSTRCSRCFGQGYMLHQLAPITVAIVRHSTALPRRSVGYLPFIACWAICHACRLRIRACTLSMQWRRQRRQRWRK